jgi:hypothetical protein
MPRDKKKEPPRKRKPAYYWWMLGNVLAACAAIVSWVLCLNIFLHPEVPRNYEILRKLGQAAVPADLDEMSAPAGEAADPRALYKRWAGLPQKALDRFNAALMKNYLFQLKEKKLIQYVEGTYKVEAVRMLDSHDLFSNGFVVRARAMLPPDEFSDPVPWPVVIEYLFPTPGKQSLINSKRAAALDALKAAEEQKKVKPRTSEKDLLKQIPEPVVTEEDVAALEASAREAASWISPGDLLTVAKFPNCAMVLHVARLEGEDTPVLCLTVTPAVFGDYAVGADRHFKLSVPTFMVRFKMKLR